MKRIIVYLMTGMVLLCGCKKKRMDVPIGPQEVLIAVNALSLDKEGTKAVSTNGFLSTSEIGIYTMVQTDPAATDLSGAQHRNFGYTNTSAAQYWQAMDPAHKILSVEGEKLSFYSYHPYSESEGSTVSLSSPVDGGDVNFNFTLRPIQNTVSDLVFNDLMYATCSGVSSMHTVADLRFRHLLTKVTCKVKVASDWLGGNVFLTKVSLSGQGITNSATLRLFDGSLTVQPVEQVGIVSWAAQDAGLALSTNPALVELIVLPGEAGGVALSLEAGGLIYDYTIPVGQNFNPSHNRIYNITLSNDASDMIVQPEIVNWEVDDEIQIKPV